MARKTRLQNLMMLSIAGGFLLSSCGSIGGEKTPTLSMEMVQTQAVATFAAGQTETAIAQPTNTSTPTETPEPTPTSTPVLTSTAGSPTLPGGGIPPTSSCYGLAFVADVTIPDNTNMTPGQKFTKTWRVRNNGSCVWEAGFKFRFTSGESMAGATLTLDKAVDPGKEVELSVALTAPNSQGTYRGNWRMSTISGIFFGDEVYVLIVVGNLTATPTAKATGSPTTTPTTTMTVTETPETAAP